ncbi:hypothetical protein GCM10027403_07090 [Arthrobacter tecti]
MFQSTTPALSFGAASSEVAAEYAGHLRVQAETLEEVHTRLCGAQDIEWESPAGRKFKEYLGERIQAVADAATRMREAAVYLEAYSSALQAAEVTMAAGQ